jgi:cell filamentation protein
MFSKYDVYVETNSKYCYPETDVLRNKLNIHDGNALKQAETDIVSVKQNYLLTHPIAGYFTPNHICRIHKFLFSDVYRFAGHYRTETIKKGKTTFLSEKDISCRMKVLLTELKKERYLTKLSYDDFIQRLAYYFSELNYIHPFREGNGRATREFIRELVQYNGYTVIWRKIEIDVLLDAMIASVFDITALVKVLKICVTRFEE